MATATAGIAKANEPVLKLNLEQVPGTAPADTSAVQKGNSTSPEVPSFTNKPTAPTASVTTVTNEDTRDDIIQAIRFKTGTERIITAAIERLVEGTTAKLPDYQQQVASALEAAKQEAAKHPSDTTNAAVQELQSMADKLAKPGDVLLALRQGKKIPWADLGTVAQVAMDAEKASSCPIAMLGEDCDILNRIQIDQFRKKINLLLNFADFKDLPEDSAFFRDTYRSDSNASTVVQGLLRLYTIVQNQHPDVFEYEELTELFKHHKN